MPKKSGNIPKTVWTSTKIMLGQKEEIERIIKEEPWRGYTSVQQYVGIAIGELIARVKPVLKYLPKPKTPEEKSDGLYERLNSDTQTI